MNVDKSLKFFVLILMLLIGVTGVYAARGLYADGSFWLFEMLSRGSFYIFDPHRAYAQMLMQLPVVISLVLGTQDLNFLIRAHSFGFVFLPLLFWLAALAIQINTRLFWFFLMAFCVTYLRSNFFAAGEFNITYGMTAFCVSILLRQNINRTLSVLLVLTSVVLTHSYEMTLFLGALLGTVSVWRLWKAKQDSVFVRTCVILAVIFFLVSSYVGFQSAFFQRAYDGRSTANLGAIAEIHFLYLITVPALATLLYATRIKRYAAIFVACLASVIIFYMFYAFRLDQSNISFGYLSYAYRALTGLILIGILIISTFFYYSASRSKTESCSYSTISFAIISTIFFISVASPMFIHTYGFSKWAQRFETTSLALAQHTPINETGINTNHGWTHGYNWVWGNTYTSILLRGNAEALVLNNSNYVNPAISGYESLKRSDDSEGSRNNLIDRHPLNLLIKKGKLF